MIHKKLHTNLILNRDFKEKKNGGGHKTTIFQKLEINFQNQKFVELSDTIKTFMYNLKSIEKGEPCFAAGQHLFAFN